MPANYKCSLCGNTIPNRKHCSIGAVGFDPLLERFASLGLTNYACRGCVQPLVPESLDKSLIDKIATCVVCDSPKKKYTTRLRLHVPKCLSHVFGDRDIYGCYECIGRYVVARIDDHFSNPSARLTCPSCRRPKGLKAFMLSEIISMGTYAYGDLHFTCRTCIESTLGWGVPIVDVG